MTSQVEDYLYRIPVSRLRESQYFKDMLDSVHTGAENEGGSDDYPIELKGISNFEMESFLDANSARCYCAVTGAGCPLLIRFCINTRFFSDECTFNWKQLAAALHLSTMWAFDGLRSRLIKHMEKDIGTVDPLDRIDVALQCRVEAWLHPAYKDLCERSTKLTAAEGERLGMARFSAICRVRESRMEATGNVQSSALPTGTYNGCGWYNGCGCAPPCGHCGYCGYCGGLHAGTRAIPNQNVNVLALIQGEPDLSFPLA